MIEKTPRGRPRRKDPGAGPAKTVAGSGRSGRPRRAPAPGERKRDADRTRHRILDAATEEFAAKGLAGARVADIAARAGVNPQLISYYFDGKRGLYDELLRRWYATESVIGGPDVPAPDVVANYLDAVLADPAWARLLVRLGIDGDPEARHPGGDEQTRSDVEGIRRRQAAGELTSEFDAAFVLVVLMSATIAPVTIPHVVEAAFGLDPASPEWRAAYLPQLQRLFAPRESRG